MKFLIPSYKRVDIVVECLLKNISFASKDDIFIFVNADEEERYKFKVKELANIVPVDKQGIVYCRHFMQKWARDNGINYYFMMDDDLTGFYEQGEYCVEKDYYKLVRINKNEIKTRLEEMERICIEQKKVFVGFCPRRIGYKKSETKFLNSLPYEFEWVDNSWYVKNDAYVPLDLFRFEDTWMGLKVIEVEKKVDSVGLYHPIIVDMLSSGYRGGCSEYIYSKQRTADNDKSFIDFPSKFPTLALKPKIRYTKEGWKNYAFGINWKVPMRVEGSTLKIVTYGAKNKKDEPVKEIVKEPIIEIKEPIIEIKTEPSNNLW